MDFKQDKTQEQSSFRSVVRSWLDRHAPRDLSFPRDGSPLPVETQEVILMGELDICERRLRDMLKSR